MHRGASSASHGHILHIYRYHIHVQITCTCIDGIYTNRQHLYTKDNTLDKIYTKFYIHIQYIN